MSRNFTQPDEINPVLQEMTKNTMDSELKSTDAKPLAKSPQSGWHTGSLSPYRAAYMKAHGLVS